MTHEPPPGGADRVRVLLVDDDPLIRSGVRAILATAPDLEIVGEAGDGRRGLDLIGRGGVDVVLLDIRMPGLDGLTTLERLGERAGGPAVVMLTTFGEEEFIDRALRLGAAGFLLKSSDPGELVAAVRAVASGAAALSPRIARRVIDRVRTIDDDAIARARRAVAALTGRELDVLALLGAGCSNAQIAARLVLSEATVKGHVSSILLKLGVAGRVHAAVLAYQAGLVQDPG